MTGWRKHGVAALLVVGILGGIASAYVYFERLSPLAPGQKPNILLLSFCSLRPQHLRAYNPKAEAMPALDAFLADSILFKNAINGLPWTNVTNYVIPTALRKFGYSNAKRKSLRIPLVPIHKNVPANNQNEALSFNNENVRNYELKYQDGLKALKKAITTTEVRPFFYSVHMKYMHFPMIDSVNQKDLWKTEFTPESARVLKEYLAAPDQYPEKAGLLLTLFADPELVKNSPFVKKYTTNVEGADPDQVRIGQIYQILSDEELIAAWKKSANYEIDLRILQEGYTLKLKNLDHELAEVFDLYGRRDLKRETVVVLTGDHGEALMEDGIFLHANHIFDNQIRFPMAIRAAGGGKKAVIEDQYSMSQQTKLLELVSATNAEPQVIQDYVKDQGESIYLRNCQGTVDGLRYANKFKLVSDLSGFHLYDVAADPLHINDLRLTEADTFFKLKDLFLNMKSLPKNLMACAAEEKRGKPLHTKKKKNKYK